MTDSDTELGEKTLYLTVSPSNADSVNGEVSVNVFQASSTTTTVSSSGGSSGGGGGGGGGIKNIQKLSYMWKELKGGSIEKWKIVQPGFGVVEMKIKVKNKATNVKMTIQKIDEGSISVEKARGKVYKYLEIIKENLDDNNLEYANIKFAVEKDWVTQNNIDVSTIKLNRFSNGWVTLHTVKVEEDEKNFYFEAETPGFSLFAITAEEVKAVGASTTVLTTVVGTPTKVKTTTTISQTKEVEKTGGLNIIAILVLVLVVLAIGILISRTQKNNKNTSKEKEQEKGKQEKNKNL